MIEPLIPAMGVQWNLHELAAKNDVQLANSLWVEASGQPALRWRPMNSKRYAILMKRINCETKQKKWARRLRGVEGRCLDVRDSTPTTDCGTDPDRLRLLRGFHHCQRQLRHLDQFDTLLHSRFLKAAMLFRLT